MEQLRSYYGVATNNLSTPEAQAALAMRALTSGISRCVSVQVTGGLDTHFENWRQDQGPIQQRGFNAVARLAKDLARTQYKDTSESWLDHTTIVGFSEFSRTARLNDRSGRDHALTNACFLLGGNIKGGTVVGASSDVGLGPQVVELATGRVVTTATTEQVEASNGTLSVLRPEHIMQTLFYDAGIVTNALDVQDDPADMRVRPVTSMLKAT